MDLEMRLDMPLFGAGGTSGGPRDAVTRLYAELNTPLRRYLVFLGVHPPEAEELAQDAFIRLHQQLLRRGEFQGMRNWLFRVAHNLAVDYQRAQSRSFDANDLLPAQTGAAEDTDPERALLRQEQTRRLHRAVRALPDLQQRCLHLRAEGFRYREIAEVLGVATSTVSESLRRAIVKLAKEDL